MSEYTNEELMRMFNDLQEINTRQQNTIDHLVDVINLYIKEDQQLCELGATVFRPDANGEDLIYRLKKRAEIRRQIPTRKSVQEGQPDRIADLLEEAANALSHFRKFTIDDSE